jgi:hypothetical protein
MSAKYLAVSAEIPIAGRSSTTATVLVATIHPFVVFRTVKRDIAAAAKSPTFVVGLNANIPQAIMFPVKQR